MTRYRRQKTKNEGRGTRDDRRGVNRPSSIVLSSLVLSVLYPLFSVFLAFAVAGCAASKNTPATNNTVQTSKDAPAEVNDEFALLEDQLVAEKIEVADPLEPVNRVMFGANDRLYLWVAKPILLTYKGIVPEPVRTGIRNFFSNVSTPVRLINCLLQGKNDAAGTELRRFAINTTAGVLGFGDPALDQHGLKPVREDLGQTLAVYGLGDGFYIVWPLFGPSTARDSLGMAGDQFLNPIRYVEPEEVSIGISIERGVNAGSFAIGTYEEFKKEAFEPYVAMREAYVQYRHNQIKE